MRRPRLASIPALACAALLGAVPVTQAALPDLEQEAPSQISADVQGGVYRLGFDSRVWNRGDGNFRIKGTRASTATPDMDVVQYDGDTGAILDGDVGTMTYSPETDHVHWHYMHFEVYELRAVANPGSLLGSQKQGFCLTAYSVDDSCGRLKDYLTEMPMGIPVGAADVYPAFIAGQTITISRSTTPNGQYVLTHRTDPQGELLEKSRANNVASTLIEVTWPSGSGVPAVQELNKCESAEWATATGCGARPASPPPSTGGGTTSPPPTGGGAPSGTGTAGGTTSSGGGSTPTTIKVGAPVSLRDARGLARTALRRTFGTLPKTVSTRCKRQNGDGFACTVSWRRGRRAYRGNVALRYAYDGATYRWSYGINVLRRTIGCTAGRTCTARVKVARSAGRLPSAIRLRLGPTARTAGGLGIPFVCELHGKL